MNRLLPLQYAFARLYPTSDEQIRMMEAAGIKYEFVALGNKPVVVWSNVFRYDPSKIDELIKISLEERPGTPELLAYQNETAMVELPKIDAALAILPANNVFEKLTGKQSTLLPIAFLQQGLIKARSVCLVKIGNTGAVGTGFLIDKDVLITNNHVLNDEDIAGTSKLLFNYEDNLDGLSLQPVEFTLDPDAYFKTSTALDFTAVKVKPNDSGTANSQFGKLELRKTITNKEEFVNIIQHPAGQKKQIGLYHNTVTQIGEKTLQYLTDTLPGASGSPVFNTNWEVVALHHAGQYIQNPTLGGPKAYNEGILINSIIDALADVNPTA
jgi:V8-like Glu-specific endopeptidase